MKCAFFPNNPIVAEMSEVVSIEPYKITTEKVYASVRKGLSRNVQVIKSFSMGEKKKIVVGIIIQGAYALPRSMDKRGASKRFAKMKKAKIAVRGKL